MDTIDHRRMIILIGAFALVGCGIIGLLLAMVLE